MHTQPLGWTRIRACRNQAVCVWRGGGVLWLQGRHPNGHGGPRGGLCRLHCRKLGLKVLPHPYPRPPVFSLGRQTHPNSKGRLQQVPELCGGLVPGFAKAKSSCPCVTGPQGHCPHLCLTDTEGQGSGRFCGLVPPLPRPPATVCCVGPWELCSAVTWDCPCPLSKHDGKEGPRLGVCVWGGGWLYC